MKKLLFLMFIGFSLNLFSQESKTNLALAKSKNEIREAAYLLRSNYQKYKSYIYFGDSIFHNIEEGFKVINLTLIKTSELEYYHQLFECGDSLAKTDNYFNKRFANSLFLALITQLNSSEVSSSVKQKKLIINKIVFSDLKYCCRFTDATSLLLIKNIKVNSAITDLVKELLTNTQRTEDEAKLIVKSSKPFFNVNDTIGFKSKVQKYKSGDKSLEFDILHIEWVQRDAKKAKMDLSAYIDSLQSVYNKQFIANYIKHPIDYRSPIIFSYDHELKDFAPYIEKIYLENLKSDPSDDRSIKKLIELVLAHFQYKNYEQTIISQISDSIKATKKNDLSRYLSYFEDLMYIKTQESVFAVAPMLLVKEKIKRRNLDIEHSIGAFIFCKLDMYIKNLPWEYHNKTSRMILINKEPTEESIDEWFIDNEMPPTFLETMYKWMIENKGKYEMRNDG